ncbi:MAG: ThuA domain-containing protein [Candidatus Hydrogenedentes bacterium]|nr:ThuA domain-containing protein [Candidatus Hydrogenedentota bacterium]
MIVRALTVLSVCIAAISAPAFAAEGKTKVLFIAGNPSHAPGDHEHRAGCMLLAKKLEEGLPNIDAEVTYYGWPKDEKLFDGVAAVVMYCDGGDGHYVNQHLDFTQALMDKGVGLVCIHYGVEVPAEPTGAKFLDWIGGYFEANWSVNPHWDATFKKLPDHPITQGVSAPFTVNDEWYYHMRFPKDMKNVTPILTANPGPDTLTRPDGPHSGNPHAREAIAKGEPQHVAWAIQRPDGGRGFGFTGGHFHRNWKDDNFRKIMLNAIAWCAKLEVPAEGVSTKTPTGEEMKANLDEKKK